MIQYGYSEAPGPLRPLGRGPRPHLPERRLGQRHGGVRARRHRRAALLPLRAGRGAARHPRRLHPQDRRRARRQADERLARRQQGATPTTWTATPSRISAGASIRRGAGTRSRSTAPIPTRHHAGARCFAGNFLFSTGPNSQGGGKRTTKGHYDVPMRDCTVTLDNDVIIERGKFADDKMRVAFVPR